MIRFTTTIKKFDARGEKSGWTYVEITAEKALSLLPGNKKSFRVKGHLDACAISQVALLPMGEGNFILPLNAAMRKAIKKTVGAKLVVELEIDQREKSLPEELLSCLEDEPGALIFFKSLAKGHQTYFGNWISSAKTTGTRTRRIAQAVNALAKKQDFGTMIRSLKNNRDNIAEM
jgi:hypothetical protein